MPTARPMVRAAGTVLWRPSRTGRGIDVGLVHRPKYDDWSLPKGKVDPGEHVLAAAVREVLEETGHGVVLGHPLTTQYYRVNGSRKEVRYWLARADDTAPPWRGTKEVDRLDFAPFERALTRLTHPRDADLVREAQQLLGAAPAPTTPLILLRHGKAHARSRWSGVDAERPLEHRGAAQADRLAVLLSSFGLGRAVSSDAVRCVDTLRPFATLARTSVELEPRLSEEAHASNPDGAAEVLGALLDSDDALVVCSHRPVLPDLLATAQAAATPAKGRAGARGRAATDPGRLAPLALAHQQLAPGAFVVLHRRDGLVRAAELHES